MQMKSVLNLQHLVAELPQGKRARRQDNMYYRTIQERVNSTRDQGFIHSQSFLRLLYVVSTYEVHPLMAVQAYFGGRAKMKEGAFENEKRRTQIH